jgi:hypothetical protein
MASATTPIRNNMSAEYSQSGTCQPSNSFCTYGDPSNCELCSILEACCQRAFARQNRFVALLQRKENNYYASQLAQFCIGPSDDHLCDDLDQASLQMVSSCTGLDDVGDESEQSSLQVVFLTTGLSVDGAVDNLEQASLQLASSCTGLSVDGAVDDLEQASLQMASTCTGLLDDGVGDESERFFFQCASQ